MNYIPKIVHYCWFGGHPKPPDVMNFIENWRSILPEYEVREWNESNFDIASWPYAKQAWEAGKFAFVSDVARLYAMYEHGGVYLDTDVEVRRSFDDLLSNSVVLGFEEGNYIATSTILAKPKSKLIGDFLASYTDRLFVDKDGSMDQTTNVQILTSMLTATGLVCNGGAQAITRDGESLLVLDQEKFSPFDYVNGIYKVDETTYAVHHFGQSWGSPMSRLQALLRRVVIRSIGGENLRRIRLALRSMAIPLSKKQH